MILRSEATAEKARMTEIQDLCGTASLLPQDRLASLVKMVPIHDLSRRSLAPGSRRAPGATIAVGGPLPPQPPVHADPAPGYAAVACLAVAYWRGSGRSALDVFFWLGVA